MKILLLMVVPMLFEACQTAKVPSSENDNTNNFYYCTGSGFIHSDSVDNVIMHASVIKLYQMEGFFSDSTITNSSDSLFDYVIKKDYGKLNVKEKELLYFALGDNECYKKNYAPIKQPFSPNFTITFIKGKEKVYFLVSLGTGEVAIVDNNSKFSFYLMKDANIIERWYNYILKARKLKRK